jgi:hypothetical protein
VPTKKALKRHPLTEDDLMGRAHRDPRALEAWERWRTITAKGGTPEAWWSEHNGYRVFDSLEWVLLNSRLRREAEG